MNIAHFFLGLPPLHDGGLMIYARDLTIEQDKKGNNVFFLFPGEIEKNNKKSFIKFFNKLNNIDIYKISNIQKVSFSGISNPKAFIKELNKNNYAEFFKNKNIDILHIHSLIGLPKELIEEAYNLGIKTIFTVHDYYGICPKIDLFKYDKKICFDYKSGYECFKCNYNSKEFDQIRRNLLILYPLIYKALKIIYRFIKQLKRKRALFSQNIIDIKCNNEKKANDYVDFRNYYLDILKKFDLIIFNSIVTKEMFSQYINLNEINYKVIPVTHSNIKDNRNLFNYEPVKNNKINFLYMGYLDYKKGFYDLIKVFEDIKQKYSNWQLNIYGDCLNIDIKDYDNEFYKFYGRYNHSDLKQIFSNISMIIIPSKWKETFGFIGLEAYSYGIPALVSENVGFSMIIKNDINGIIYKEDSNNDKLKESIISILENPQILKKFNQAILKDDFSRYLINNHTEEVINLYKSLYNRGI